MTDRFDDHTLLVTTFNRPTYLYRLLKFVADDLPIGRVLVVDGSIEPHRSHNREVVDAFAERMRVDLRQLEPGISWYDEICAALEAVSTPYVTYSQDDNFPVAALSREAVLFLRANPDYVACGGQTVSIGHSGGALRASVVNVAAVDQDDPLDRFVQFFSNHWNAEFGTWRTDALRAGTSALALMPRDQTMGEPLHPGLGALEGKFQVLPGLAILFAWHGANISGNQHQRYGPTTPDFSANIGHMAAEVEQRCRAAGLAAPGDLRGFCIRAYLQSMLKWHDDARDIVPERACLSTDEVSSDAWRALIVRARHALLASLAGLDHDAIETIDAEISSAQSTVFPPPLELMVVEGDKASVEFGAAQGPAMEKPFSVSPAGPMPEFLQPIMTAMADTEWWITYERFFEGAAAMVLGFLQHHSSARQIFDTVFQQALTDLVRPSLTFCPQQQRVFADLLRLGDVDGAALGRILDAARLFEAYPDANWSTSASPVPAEPGPMHISYRAPTEAAERWPIDVDMAGVMEKGAFTFIPLKTNEAIADLLAGGHGCWLEIRIADLTGKVQFSLFKDGKMAELTTVRPAGAAQTVHLPIREPDYAFLILRDLANGDAPSRCALESLRLYVSAHPLLYPRPCESAGRTAA